MSATDTDTKLILPSEAKAAIKEGRAPRWKAPLTTRWSHEGKHRLNEDLTTREISAERIADLRERARAVPVVSAPVHVPEPVKASSSPSKLAMLAANMRRWARWQR